MGNFIFCEVRLIQQDEIVQLIKYNLHSRDLPAQS